MDTDETLRVIFKLLSVAPDDCNPKAGACSAH
jgi:hypothetical protein